MNTLKQVKIKLMVNASVAEPELEPKYVELKHVELKLFWGSRAGAVISYRYFGSCSTGSGADIIFLIKFYYTFVSLEDARINQN